MSRLSSGLLVPQTAAAVGCRKLLSQYTQGLTGSVLCDVDISGGK